MAKKRLGISIYPEYASMEDNLKYIETASKYGFDVLFLALQGQNGTKEEIIESYRPYTKKAKELGFEIFADVNPMFFDAIGVNVSMFRGPIDLSFFKELEIDSMRLDLGLSDLEEAYLTKNKDGIKICLNGASRCDHVGHVLAAGGDPEKLVGCHNYYPHRYTGVSLSFFNEGTSNWKKHNLRLQSFVSSNSEDAFGPWEVTEGLPTLEMHRDWPIEYQTKHYLMMGTVDDIIIGNCFATEDELSKMASVNNEKVTFDTTLVENLPEKMKERLKMQLSKRGDENEYIIRTLESRMMRENVEPFNTVDIKAGDVLIDNKLYGQYAGEVQIALKDMKNYGKTNVVGHISEIDKELIKYLKGGQPFEFKF
ncbi:DUF871 domain-containing protein [Peptacetobacter sp.]|uniref:DUF871 domain-containing protein n=1 Tax=Peptacetobacter sp. TaxID=2991975 RepID=UPI0026362813|nr:MupG family TIM beta-alpha barrel fold protein [Peptacetobacter sp.]